MRTPHLCTAHALDSRGMAVSHTLAASKARLELLQCLCGLPLAIGHLCPQACHFCVTLRHLHHVPAVNARVIITAAA